MRDEVIQGYVVDLACLRKYPRDEFAQRAERHSRECALMGHCIESGFALVEETGRVALLDASATPKVVNAIRSAESGTGIRLRIRREANKDGYMETTDVEVFD